MDNPDEIRKMSKQRLKAAEILITYDMPEDAFYLAGHSVELSLKARLCEHFNFPNLFNLNEYNSDTPIPNIGNIKKITQIHNLDELMLLCGLYFKFTAFIQTAPEILDNIILIRTFNDIRYKKIGSINTEKVKQIISFINDKENGLLQWIQNN